MPCFKGLAVSIHTPDGPLQEHSIQRQARASRITSYIPVPPAKIPPASSTNIPEQSSFAISITLLTPGITVPYSAAKPTEDDPYPQPQVVGPLPRHYGEKRGKFGPGIGPYIPLTSSGNETVAAYIYFDGRNKEEVATLLRRGEETWVNSRWVSVPDSEGGGLAEREFLFREVGLERWLNGLDLEGKDAAEKKERRRQRLEKKRRQKQAKSEEYREGDMNMEEENTHFKIEESGGRCDPTRNPHDDDGVTLSSDTDSDDDPVPEATGQIKVALFRVLASGEIKRGEYSPQFDAHDDDEDGPAGRGGATNGETGQEEIDHTTSFAKPKTLDPKTISTQTVTGIDSPDKPYAVFTFLYRGERQLQKMGILQPSQSDKTAAPSSKRRSVQTDFSKLGPLKAGGTVGFSSFRDNEASPKTKRDKKGSSDMDSDDDDEPGSAPTIKAEDEDSKPFSEGKLTVEDTQREGELEEGVRKIKLKRAHSAEPIKDGPRKSPAGNSPNAGDPPRKENEKPPPSIYDHDLPGKTSEQQRQDETLIGSPLKKARPSLPGLEESEANNMRYHIGSAGALGDVLGVTKLSPGIQTQQAEDEEL